MDRLEALERLLEASSILVDWAAQEIVAMPFEPKRQNLELAVLAQSALKDLKLKLYQERPDLTPRHLRADTPRDPKVKAYDDKNPIPPEIQQKLEITTAIKILECLQGLDRNVHLSKFAKEHLPRLRAQLNHET